MLAPLDETCEKCKPRARSARDAERAKRVSRGREAPEHIRLGGLGERRKLPNVVRGEAPASNNFGVYGYEI